MGINRMKLISPVLALLALAGWFAVSETEGAVAPSDMRGRSLYLENCSACHGQILKGGFGPPIVGRAFLKRWSDRSEELARYIAQKMPPRAPGSLDRATYGAITDYVLRAAGLKDGTEPMVSAGADERGEAATRDSNGSTSVRGSSSETDSLAAPPNQDSQFHAEVSRREALASKMTPITDSTLQDPDDADWPMWRRNYEALGFSPLADINRSNVNSLRLAWSLSLASGTNEITPLAYQGMLFVNSSGTVQALDAATGDVIWQFKRPSKRLDPVSQPRGLALSGTKLFVPQEDGYMFALDARTGAVIWQREIVSAAGKIQLTSGPLVVRGKVIQGVSGCSSEEVIGGCFVIALDAESGQELWRFATIARPGEPDGDSWNGAPLEQRFGASVWSTPSYDSNSNLVYVGTGNTYHTQPLLSPKRPPSAANAALYTNTTLALNPDTGRLAWHYQHFTRDVWNQDWALERSIINLPTRSGVRRVVVTSGKLGIVDVLDAKTGAYIFSHDLGIQDLVSAIDKKTGRKIVSDEKWPDLSNPQPKVICPYSGGGRNWYATAFDPLKNLMYIPTVEACMRFYGDPIGSRAGLRLQLLPPPRGDGNFGRVTALDLSSNTVRWVNRRRSPQSSAILATAGGLIFEGGRDRTFRALNSDTGEVIWSARLDSIPDTFPITFKVGEVQYIALTTGGGGLLDSTLPPLTPETEDPPASTTLWVFELPPGTK
jgi:alcohol dehydrogenase (cytochrome c)